jgi:prepilin-type N-terminal cleavage/methylation domain-containing protein
MAVSTQTPPRCARLVSSSRQAAFTLIELLVVILIIGILIAIAVPTFLNQQQKAQNSAAQQTLAVAYKDAKANMATNGGTFPDYQTLAAQIASAEPEYTVGTAIFSSDQAVTAGPYGKLWVLLGSTGSNGTLASTNGQNLYLADVSKSGAVCTLTVTNDGPPVYGNCGGTSSGSAGANAAAAATSAGSVLITGVAKQGQQLTATLSGWSGGLTYNYQWQDCNTAGNSCTNISGASGPSNTYTPVSNDVDQTIDVIVTGTGSSGSASATSAQTGAVAAGSAPAESVLPLLSGYAQDGQTMAVTTGTWTGSGAKTYTYQWQKCTGSGTGCSSVPGATAATYTIPAGSSGSYYQAMVTATSSGGSTPATSSNNSGAVAMSYDEVLMSPPNSYKPPFAMWDFNGGSLVDPISGQGSITENSGITAANGPYNNPVYQGLAFSGSSSYGTLPDSNTTDCSNTTANVPSTDTTQGEPYGCVVNATSIEIWFKTTSDGVLISETNSPYPDTTINDAVPAIYVGTDGHLYAAIWQYSVLESDNTVNDGNWHDALFYTAGTVGYMYIDGVLQSTTSSGNWSNAYAMTSSQLGVGYTSPQSLWTNTNNAYFFYTGTLGPIALSSYGAGFTNAEALAQYKAMNQANYTIH